MIIANTLIEGQVVFLTADGNWTHDIEHGAVALADEEAAALLLEAKQAETANKVIDPYLIPITVNMAAGSPPNTANLSGPTARPCPFLARKPDTIKHVPLR